MLVLVLQPLLTALLRSFRRGQRLLLKADGAARGSEALQVRSAAPLPHTTSARSPAEPRPHGGPESRAAAGERGHDVRGCGPGAAAAGRLPWGASVGSIWGLYGVDWLLGSFSGLYGVDLLLGSPWSRFGVSIGSPWGHFGVPMGSIYFWGPLGVPMGSIWGLCGVDLLLGSL